MSLISESHHHSNYVNERKRSIHSIYRTAKAEMLNYMATLGVAKPPPGHKAASQGALLRLTGAKCNLSDIEIFLGPFWVAHGGVCCPILGVQNIALG